MDFGLRSFCRPEIYCECPPSFIRRGGDERGGAKKILINALLLLYELFTNLNIIRIGKSVTRKVGERFISDRHLANENVSRLHINVN